MNEQEIDALIERAGLSDVMQVFGSAVEIDVHQKRPDGGFYDGYSALAALLRVYGDERAREMNDQCAVTVRDAANKMRGIGGEDATMAAMIQMCVKLLGNAERAIRALPVE